MVKQTTVGTKWTTTPDKVTDTVLITTNPSNQARKRSDSETESLTAPQNDRRLLKKEVFTHTEDSTAQLRDLFWKRNGIIEWVDAPFRSITLKSTDGSSDINEVFFTE